LGLDAFVDHGHVVGTALEAVTENDEHFLLLIMQALKTYIQLAKKVLVGLEGVRLLRVVGGVLVGRDVLVVFVLRGLKVVGFALCCTG
jgi:hypothetical protein